MKQTSYEILVKSVLAGAPALAKEVIDDLNATLEDYDKLKSKSTMKEPAQLANQESKKKEN